MIHPNIDELLQKVESKYTLAMLAAKRARQINNQQIYFKKRQVNSLAALPINVDFSIMKKKPVTAALEEIYEGRTEYRIPDED